MKIENALLLIDNMSGDPDQDFKVIIKENFTVESFKELEQVVDQALYTRFKRDPSEKRSEYNQFSGVFKIYYYYDKTDENGEYEAYFTCEPVIDTDNFKIIGEKLKK